MPPGSVCRQLFLEISNTFNLGQDSNSWSGKCSKQLLLVSNVWRFDGDVGTILSNELILLCETINVSSFTSCDKTGSWWRKLWLRSRYRRFMQWYVNPGKWARWLLVSITCVSWCCTPWRRCSMNPMFVWIRASLRTKRGKVRSCCIISCNSWQLENVPL